MVFHKRQAKSYVVVLDEETRRYLTPARGWTRMRGLAATMNQRQARERAKELKPFVGNCIRVMPMGEA